MEIIYNSLALLHFIGLASLFGGFLVQISAAAKVINPAMFHGSLTQLVTGILLVGLAESGVVDEDLNMGKIIVKLIIVLIITGIVFVNKKKSSVSTAIWASVGLLTFVNMAVAVYI